MYFGIAHLLDYPAPYDRYLYRFADFNAGHYASRNAAFQRAVTRVSGIPLELDGDLLRYGSGQPAREPGGTELATRVLARRIDLDNQDIRRDLQRRKGVELRQTRLYKRVFDVGRRRERQSRCRKRSCRAFRCAARRSRESSPPSGLPDA